ncbi:MAG: iron-containing alcohol dehydrogenase [Nitrospinota bacterium]|nr:iron-containing alcohol dehydrogenase [Nitrospinota bacterium]
MALKSTPQSPFAFRMPVKLVFGEGAGGDVSAEMSELGCRMALVVTDEHVATAGGAFDKLIRGLGPRLGGVFRGVTQDSGYTVIDEGAKMAADAGADCVISVGGGSVIDTGKGISVVLKNGGSIRDHMGVNILAGPQTPHIVLPTTSGTGSEVTNVAVIYDSGEKRKKNLLDHNIFPNTAVLDPEFLVHLPPAITASTGMDAVTHAIEALHSVMKNPVSDSLAMQALRLMGQWLPVAWAEPVNLAARGHTLVGSNLAGGAFSNAMVGLCHAIAHGLGGVARVPHGLANSICLPHVMRFNMEEDPQLYDQVAEALGLGSGAEAPGWVLDMARRMELPTTLKDAGVAEEALGEVAEAAMTDGAALYNPRPVFEPEEIMPLLRMIWAGE